MRRASAGTSLVLIAALLLLMLGLLPAARGAATVYTVVPGRIVGDYKLTWPSPSAVETYITGSTALPGEAVISSGGVGAYSFINGEGSYVGEVVTRIVNGGTVVDNGPVPHQVTGTYAVDVQTGPNASPPFAHLPDLLASGVSWANSTKGLVWPVGAGYLQTGPVPPLPATERHDITVPVAAIHVRGMCNGQVAMVQSFGIRSWVTSPPADMFGYHDPNLTGPVKAEATVLVPAGVQLARIILDWKTGTDPASDTFKGEGSMLHVPGSGPFAPGTGTIPILAPGEIFHVDFDIPCAGGTNCLASGTGVVDLLGREEIKWSSIGMTAVGANHSDGINGRNGTMNGAPNPSSGPFTLINMLPGNYSVSAYLILKGKAAVAVPAGVIDATGTPLAIGDPVPEFYETFTPSPVRADFNCPGPTDLGDTFKMEPGLIHGNILLSGPKASAGCPNWMNTLLRATDPASFIQTGDGAGAFIGLNAYAAASGVVTGEAAGGQASSLFPGYHRSQASAEEFSGYYQMHVASPHSAPGTWSPTTLNLAFNSSVDKVYNNLSITRSDRPAVTINPGSAVSAPGSIVVQPLEYCMSQVTIKFISPGNTPFHSPSVSYNGHFGPGTDFLGHVGTDYSISGTGNGFIDLPPLTGPTVPAGYGLSGEVRMVLPQGKYGFSPAVNYLAGSGGLPGIGGVEVGCRQCLTVTPGGPTIAVEQPAPCVALNLLTNGIYDLQGAAQVGVDSGATLASVKFSVNGGAEQVLCSGSCGTSYAFIAPCTLNAGNNTIVITTVDSNGLVATTTVTITASCGNPVFTGCPTGPIDLGCDPASLPDCASALALVTAHDACSGLLTPLCSAGAVQVNGSQRSQTFALTATDACNNSTTCAVTYTWSTNCETNSNCCDGCVPDGNGQYPASFTVTVLPGWNALVNPLCHGTNNLLIDIIPNAPVETQVIKWDKVTHVFTQTDVFDPGLGGWVDPNTADPNNTTTLPPGEGFFLFNPGPAFTITYTGCEPHCPPRCPKTNDLWFVGKTGSTPGMSTWESLFGTNCPPLCGSTVRIFNGGIQIYQDYVYLGGAGWSPSTPTWTNGNSVFVFWQATNCDSCVTLCASNKTVECGAAWTFDPPTSSCTNTTIAEISTVTNGICPMVVTRRWVVTDATGHASYCEQEVTVADTVPPVLQGCVDLATNSLTTASGNYVSFTVTALDACEGVLPVHCDPPSGSFFPVGQTLVHCSAVDRCGNSNACTFFVTVRAGCVEIVEETIRCTGTNGLDSYRFCVRNNTDHDLGHLTIVNLPSGVSATPYFLTLTPPLSPGQTRCVTVTLSGVDARTNLCFRLMAHSPDFEECCIVTHCATIVRSAPQIRCPENIAVEAASPATNAVVNFTVQAADGSSNTVPVICTPASGSTFPCGTTVVNCVARDACGNTSTCSFTVTVRCHGNDRCDLFIQDTPVYYAGAPDQGNEPDANMIGQPMWTSRGIWVHTDCVQPPGTYLTHQNPYYGQQNCVFAEIKNRGASAVSGAKVELYYANASLGLSWPAQWTLIGTVTLPTIAAGGTHIAQAPWFPPGTGHYCLVARIVSDCDPMTTPEGTDINANVRANNNLAWRNVNVTDCLHAPGDKVEVRVRNFEPAPKKLTLVFTADDDFLPDGGTAILSPGSSIFQRWMDAGGKGSNVQVINGNEIRFTGSPATFEDIPFGENEERVFNLTLRADQPMPVPGTSHVYHAHLMQKIDGTPVGGVAYTIVTRALDTDTDGDGIKDVDDPDDDNDGVPDEDDNNPVGDLDCPPAALTINRNGQEVTITWGGLNYRLQSVHNFGDVWEDVPNASSPYVRTADGDHRFYRLICR